MKRIEKTQVVFIEELSIFLPENFDKEDLFPRIQLQKGFIVRLNLTGLNLKQLPKSILHRYKLRILRLSGN